MKSFKRYVKESLALGTGVSNTTAFSSDAGGGSASGHPVDGISSDDIVSNVSQKGDGKKVNVVSLVTVTRGIQDKSIIKDDETGSLRYRTFGGEYMNSPYAAVARSEREIADVAAERGASWTAATMGAETIAQLIRIGQLRTDVDSEGKGVLVPIPPMPDTLPPPPPLRSGDASGGGDEDDDVIGDDKGDPTSDEQTWPRQIGEGFWENEDGTIDIWNRETGEYERYGPDGERIKEDPPNYDDWEIYQQWVDWFTGSILDILLDERGEKFRQPVDFEGNPIDNPDEPADPNLLPPEAVPDSFDDVAGDQIRDFIRDIQDHWDDAPGGPEGDDHPPRPIPKRPAGYDATDDEYRRWKERNPR